jgi:Flp pilus assembly pilin Flp
MRRFIDRFQRDQRGATAIEYGLIGGLMTVAILGAFAAFQNSGMRIAFDKLMATFQSFIDG